MDRLEPSLGDPHLVPSRESVYVRCLNVHRNDGALNEEGVFAGDKLEALRSRLTCFGPGDIKREVEVSLHRDVYAQGGSVRLDVT